ncbi:hypothetical protein ACWD64_20035 [Streptomyces antibioticus]
MSAEDEVAAEVRRLAGQDVSRREIARRLGLTRYRVGQVLADPSRPRRVTVACPVDQPPAPADVAERPVAEPSAGVRPLPVRLVDRQAMAASLADQPGLRRDLAVLAQTGRSAEALVHQAVTALAHAYRLALDSGRLTTGTAFIVRAMDLVPAAHLADRPVADPADGG